MTAFFVFFLLQILSVIPDVHSNNDVVVLTLLKQLVFNVCQTTDPYQIVFIKNENMDDVYFDVNYVRTLFRDFPTVTIDFQNFNILDNITKYDTGSLRQSSLFIVLYFQSQQKDLSDIEILQNRYVEIFPRSPRPKWLILLFTENTDQEQEISLHLQKSWEKKFLDITIVEVNFENIIVYHYNPFSCYLTRQHYVEGTDIFPDKIQNMNGHSLSTIFYSDPPGIHVTYNADDTLEISGIHYWIIQTVSNVMNFTLEVYDSGDFNFTRLLDAIENSEIDFSGNQIYFWNNEPFDKSMILKSDGYCVVVPILQVPSARAKNRLYFGLILTLFHILIVVSASKLLKFDRKIWTWINIFEIILGMPAPQLPRKLGERLLVGCVIVLSLTYTSVFYARMTDNNLKAREELPFNNFQDLDDSGLTPLVNADLYNNTFDVFDKDSVLMKNLKKKAGIWNDPISCVDEMSRNKTIACIMSEELGNFLINKHKDDNGILTMKVMQPCFWITWRGYAFSPGSPYRERFDAIVVRIFESGLIKKWIENNDFGHAQKVMLSLDTRFILEHMSTILTAGYFISGLAFFVELIIYYFLS